MTSRTKLFHTAAIASVALAQLAITGPLLAGNVPGATAAPTTSTCPGALGGGCVYSVNFTPQGYPNYGVPATQIVGTCNIYFEGPNGTCNLPAGSVTTLEAPGPGSPAGTPTNPYVNQVECKVGAMGGPPASGWFVQKATTALTSTGNVSSCD
jgi:hypothetical protein